MSNSGRKNVYDSKIKPKFQKIAELAQKGVTEKDIAKAIGVSYSTFNKYKSEKKEFAELLKKNRAFAVDEIENAMFQRATGGVKTLKKAMKCRIVEYGDNGKRAFEKEVVVPYEEEVFFPPDTTAGIYLLKHWGKDRGYTNDPMTLDIKRRELELKEKSAEENNW